jgi:hypothetical protein
MDNLRRGYMGMCFGKLYNFSASIVLFCPGSSVDLRFISLSNSQIRDHTTERIVEHTEGTSATAGA